METENFISMGLAVPVILAVSFIDWGEDPGLLTSNVNVWILRGVFLAVQMLVLAAIYLTYRRIKQMPKDGNKITAQIFSFFGNKTGKTETLSTRDYDMREWGTFARGVVIALVIIILFHLQSHFVAPLAIAIIVMPYRLYACKLVQIHILNASGPDLIRPFKSDNHFAELMDQVKELSGKGESKRKKVMKRPGPKTIARIKSTLAK